jgi:hypothetical protein
MSDWTVKADLGSGYIDITEHCSKIRRRRAIHRNLKPTIDQCEFQLHDQDIAQYVLLTKEVPVKIWKDDEAYFVGIVRETGHMKHAASLKGMNVECVDYGYMLRDKINSDLIYQDIQLADAGDKNNSFLDLIFEDAGFSSSVLNFGTINLAVRSVIVASEERRSYWEVLLEVLYEYGYVFYQDESGVFQPYDLFPTSISAEDLIDRDILHSSSYTREEEEYERVEITWHPIVDKNDIIVFSDQTDQDQANKCNIVLATDEYYPANCNSQKAYAQYKTSEGYDILRVTNASLDTEMSGVSVNAFNPGPKQAEICFYSASGGTITQLDIRGDAELRDTNNINKKVRVVTAGTDRILRYLAKIIANDTLAERLASGLAEWFSTSIHQLTFSTDKELDPGDFITVDSETIDIDSTFRVVSVEDTNNHENIKIKAERIDSVTISTDEEDFTYTPIRDNIPENEFEKNPFNSPTYNEAIRDGWNAGYGTTTPTIPVITCTGGRRAVLIEWSHQVDLTNFDHYEIQVSEDDSTWYSLGLDGTDWKGTLDGVTETESPFFIHTEIPLLGTSEDPEARTLYYRVRRVTKEPLQSNWSTSQSAEAGPTLGSDLLAGTIAGEKLVARTITADKIGTREIKAENMAFGTSEYLAHLTHPIPENAELFEFADLSCRGSDGSYPEDKFIVLDEDAYTWQRPGAAIIVSDQELGNGERLDQEIAMNKSGQLTLENWEDIEGGGPGDSIDYGFNSRLSVETENVISGGAP